MEISWPDSGARQRFNGVSPNQSLEVTEFSDTYVKRNQRRVRLGGANGS